MESGAEKALYREDINPALGIDDGFSNAYTILLAALENYLSQNGTLQLIDITSTIPNPIPTYEEYLRKRAEAQHQSDAELQQILRGSNQEKVAELNRRVVAVNAARELLFREEPFSLIGFKELLRGVVDRLHDLDDELMRPVA